jgi:hypothetical protein
MTCVAATDPTAGVGNVGAAAVTTARKSSPADRMSAASEAVLTAPGQMRRATAKVTAATAATATATAAVSAATAAMPLGHRGCAKREQRPEQARRQNQASDFGTHKAILLPCRADLSPIMNR